MFASCCLRHSLDAMLGCSPKVVGSVAESGGLASLDLGESSLVCSLGAKLELGRGCGLHWVPPRSLFLAKSLLQSVALYRLVISAQSLDF